jgi:hypothetical protein
MLLLDSWLMKIHVAEVLHLVLQQVRSLELPLAIPKGVSNEALVERTSPLPPSLVSNAPSPIDETFHLASLNEIKISSKDFRLDEVVRIVDANTIKLQKNEIVSVAGARCPSAGSNLIFRMFFL